MEMDTGPRSCSRAPEHDLAWQLPAPTAPPGLGQADTVPRRLCLGDFAQEALQRQYFPDLRKQPANPIDFGGVDGWRKNLCP
jgi:hypothetical protein